jgi:hypothetical protein
VAAVAAAGAASKAADAVSVLLPWNQLLLLTLRQTCWSSA